jgi:catechol 2,3-dioxygenase
MPLTRRKFVSAAASGAVIANVPSSSVISGEPNAVLESHKAPLHIRSVTLKARKMKDLAAYYEQMIGLERISETAEDIILGSGGVGYFQILSAPEANPEPRRTAGLFHTAFLLPSRAALGAWFKATFDKDMDFEAASDHGVSEAFYLTDPEGNGIEVYADRPRKLWPRDGKGYDMTTGQMDVQSVLEDGLQTGVTKGQIPAASRIGHVHLKVGDLNAAEQFYTSVVGLDITNQRSGGTFFSSGGYHHHIAANTWTSAGAPPRPNGMTGLSRIDFAVTDEAVFADIHKRLSDSAANPVSNLTLVQDPWAIAIAFTRGERQ